MSSAGEHSGPNIDPTASLFDLDDLPSLLDVPIEETTVYQGPEAVVVVGDDIAVSIGPGSDRRVRHVDPATVDQPRFDRVRDLATGDRTGD